MIWSDKELRAWAKHSVTPYREALINPASIDLRLGPQFCVPTNDGWSEPIRTSSGCGILLVPGQLYLLHTIETTAIPDNAAAFLFLKSSTGRRGIEHLHAGYGDPGFVGQWTLEIINHWPYAVTVYPGRPFVQLVLMDTGDVDKTYDVTGHYCGQRGPTGPYSITAK